MSLWHCTDIDLIVPPGGDQHQAEQLAAQLHLAIDPAKPNARFQLHFAADGFFLLDTTAPKSPLKIDFNSNAYQYLLHSVKQSRNHLLSRAIGVKHKPIVWDMTAGLGRDSFVLASLGCEVHAFERSPVMAILLADGLKRLHCNTPQLAETTNLTLHPGNSLDTLTSPPKHIPTPNTIFIDPMFAPRQKSALNQQAMRTLHDLVGEDDDKEELVTAALALATQISCQVRVLVKQAVHQDAFQPHRLNHQYTGRGHRLDLYVA